MHTTPQFSASLSHKSSATSFHVLFADSDIEMHDLYRRFFQSRLCEVETVASGVECVAALREIRPSALVLHRNLLWGGFEGVVDRIRCEKEIPPLPVVAVQDRAFDRPSHDPPVVATLNTPFRMGELDRVLRSVFASSVIARARRAT